MFIFFILAHKWKETRWPITAEEDPKVAHGTPVLVSTLADATVVHEDFQREQALLNNAAYLCNSWFIYYDICIKRVAEYKHYVSSAQKYAPFLITPAHESKMGCGKGPNQYRCKRNAFSF